MCVRVSENVPSGCWSVYNGIVKGAKYHHGRVHVGSVGHFGRSPSVGGLDRWVDDKRRVRKT